jgi:hypothetical protein
VITIEFRAAAAPHNAAPHNAAPHNAAPHFAGHHFAPDRYAQALARYLPQRAGVRLRTLTAGTRPMPADLYSLSTAENALGWALERRRVAAREAGRPLRVGVSVSSPVLAELVPALRSAPPGSAVLVVAAPPGMSPAQLDAALVPLRAGCGRLELQPLVCRNLRELWQACDVVAAINPPKRYDLARHALPLPRGPLAESMKCLVGQPPPVRSRADPDPPMTAPATGVGTAAATAPGTATAPALFIPRIFHRIWLGCPMPERERRFGETWVEHHPDWEMRLWHEGNLPPLVNQAQFDAAASPAQRADILRYELLLEYGGVYLDTDFECFRNIEPLLAGVRAFTAREDAAWVAIGVLGCVPGHPLFAAVVAELPDSIAWRPGRPPNEQTGPQLFSRVLVEQEALGLEAPTVFGPELFYPYHATEPHRAGEYFPQAYAAHHWSKSWVGTAGISGGTSGGAA